MTGCHWGVWLVENMHVATPNKMQNLVKAMSNIFVFFSEIWGYSSVWTNYEWYVISHQKSSDIKPWNWDAFLWFPVEQPSFNRGSEVAGFCPEIWWTPRALVHRLGCCSMTFHDVPPADLAYSYLVNPEKYPEKYWINEHQHSPVMSSTSFGHVHQSRDLICLFHIYFLKNKVTHILKYDQIWTPKATCRATLMAWPWRPAIYFTGVARVWDWRAWNWERAKTTGPQTPMERTW